jgi:hypothetical protein
MFDLEHFFKGLGTIADILMGIESHISPFPDQGQVTISGLINLIDSAEELLKGNHISEDQYVLLLGATFSRHPSMELVFSIFRSSMYHKLILENRKNEQKIGKGILFDCIDNLTKHDKGLIRVHDGHRLMTARLSSVRLFSFVSCKLQSYLCHLTSALIVCPSQYLSRVVYQLSLFSCSNFLPTPILPGRMQNCHLMLLRS